MGGDTKPSPSGVGVTGMHAGGLSVVLGYDALPAE